MYDYILKNGWLVDFDTGGTAIGDVYVKNGRIVPAGSHGEDTAAEIFDATGKYVLPGLIDSHIHVHYDGSNGVHADTHCPANGVTTAVDGGSAGTATFPLFERANALRYMTTVKSFITPSPWGVLDTLHTETHDPEAFDEKAVLKAYETFPDSILGLKLRMDEKTIGDYGAAPVDKAIRIAEAVRGEGHRCILNVHVANLPRYLDVSEILDRLRPGDIFVHAFQNRGQTIFDASGNILECAKKARARGVIFDCCTGRIHWSLENFRRAVAGNFLPDIISSDIIRESSYVKPGFSIVHAMCALLACGMNEIEIFKAVTRNPARILGLEKEAGSLAPGMPADIAVFDLIDRDLRLFDRFGGEVTAKRIFVPLMTLKKGEIVFRQIFF